MKRSPSALGAMALVAAMALGACSAGNGSDTGDGGESGDADPFADAADIREAGDSAGADIAADTSDDQVPVEEIDDTPGCAGDFCAAGPDYAPDPAEWGPFPVGVTTMELDLVNHEGKPRSIRVEIWYPTTDEFNGGPFELIDIYGDCPAKLKPYVEKFKELVPPIQTQASRDTPGRRGDGPYPLVLFSHGAYGVRYQSVFFTIYLASHGYVVASMDHTNNTLYDILGPKGYNMEDVILSSFDRPYDSVVTITAVLARNDKQGDLLYKMMNPDEIGMSGHSFGGFTSFLMANLDGRIKAIVPMAPATAALGISGYPLEGITIPVLMMMGMKDKTLTPEREMLPAYPKLNPPKGFLKFLDGGHYTFSDICQLDLEKVAEEANFGDAGDAIEDGCGPENTPVAVAHPIIRRFGIGIFNYYLRHSPGSLKYFDAAAGAAVADVADYEVDLGGLE